jgi:F-type H+-transporting ATPase subunit delta
VTTASQRQASAGLRARLDEHRADPALPGLPAELFAAADVIDADNVLRSALSDSGQPLPTRTGTVRSLFGGRLSELAVDTLADVASQRWPDPTALVEAIEGLAAQAAFIAAEGAGSLDDVENELFTFSRAVSTSADLQLALTDPAVGSQEKAGLVRTLLDGRAGEQSTTVLAHAMSTLRGRRADAVISDLIDLAAEQRGRSVAEVRVAVPLTDEQAGRLQAVLTRRYGRDIRLNVAVDPQVVGGVSVRVGSEVLDGTLASRIEQARRTLVG